MKKEQKFSIGMKVKINIDGVIYSEEEISEGCTYEANRKTGLIDTIFKKEKLIMVLLDEPFDFVDEDRTTRYYIESFNHFEICE